VAPTRTPPLFARRAFVRGLGHGAAALGLATAAHRLVFAQRPVDLRGNDFRAGAELVTTPVTVLDAAGRLVTSLERDAFRIEEDGVPEPITQFTRDRVPVSLALALDISDSMRGQRMLDAREALARFLADLLAPEDEAALVTFNHDAHVLSSWTSDRSALRTRLDGARPTGGTAMYDAVAATLPLFESRTHPRAALLLVSDGADTASDMTPTRLKQSLVRSDVFLYAIAIDSASSRSSTRVNAYTLNELTAQGGGYTEIITSAADLGPATARIADELNHQYMLGYTPTASGNGQYRAIRVRVTSPEYKVRARRGVIR